MKSKKQAKRSSSPSKKEARSPLSPKTKVATVYLPSGHGKGQKSGYCVVQAFDAHSLVQGVQAMMDQGWNPEGGVAVVGKTLYQALKIED